MRCERAGDHSGQEGDLALQGQNAVGKQVESRGKGTLRKIIA